VAAATRLGRVKELEFMAEALRQKKARQAAALCTLKGLLEVSTSRVCGVWVHVYDCRFVRV
jgi:hypothetical protein